MISWSLTMLRHQSRMTACVRTIMFKESDVTFGVTWAKLQINYIAVAKYVVVCSNFNHNRYQLTISLTPMSFRKVISKYELILYIPTSKISSSALRALVLRPMGSPSGAPQWPWSDATTIPVLQYSSYSFIHLLYHCSGSMRHQSECELERKTQSNGWDFAYLSTTHQGRLNMEHLCRC